MYIHIQRKTEKKTVNTEITKINNYLECYIGRRFWYSDVGIEIQFQVFLSLFCLSNVSHNFIKPQFPTKKNEGLT